MKQFVLRYRVFIYAVLVSAAWHIFWISAITIVVAPGRGGPVKFSRVTFLGPILEKWGGEVRIEPQARSFLESRYLKDAQHAINAGIRSRSPAFEKYDNTDRMGLYPGDDKMAYFVDDAVRGKKLEPSGIPD